MPAKKGTKRKSTSPPPSNGEASKRPRAAPNDPLRRPHPFHEDAERHGIVLRRYYPHEMSTDRARAYNQGELPRPIEILETALKETWNTRRAIKPGKAIVHWFKMDLRTTDNTALSLASEKAKESGVPLIAMYLVSPQDFEAHLTAPVKLDFMLRTLQVLKKDLAKLNIPLYVETVEKRKAIPGRIIELLEEWGARHFFANMEYEVDELRREAALVRSLAERGIAMDVVHDSCVVQPGMLKSQAGKQYAVYTPWFRSWIMVARELEPLLDSPSKNPDTAKQEFGHLFDCEIPSAPESKMLDEQEAQRFRSQWPAGEHEAKRRLENFCKHRILTYHERRNIPSDDGTSSLSVHLASGTISARTCIAAARDRNKPKVIDRGSQGIQTWISEVAWRDFYKHVMVNWPYVCMNKPFKPEYANIEWSYNQEHFQAWCEGRTGFPLVDAAMRQLLHLGWMHNRCRMVVASFLAKDLLIDWRMGERWFMEHLVDGDFASNNGGWGFSSSVGVDPQPYFRIFNPWTQSEKFDPDGDYIRRWVPELEAVEGKAIHDPHNRGAADEAERVGYPSPIVDHKESRQRALSAYKAGIERNM